MVLQQFFYIDKNKCSKNPCKTQQYVLECKKEQMFGDGAEWKLRRKWTYSKS